ARRCRVFAKTGENRGIDDCITEGADVQGSGIDVLRITTGANSGLAPARGQVPSGSAAGSVFQASGASAMSLLAFGAASRCVREAPPGSHRREEWNRTTWLQVALRDFWHRQECMAD